MKILIECLYKIEYTLIECHLSRKCTILKKSKNESFGFQVNGKTNLKGNHSVSSVLKKSCAD